MTLNLCSVRGRGQIMNNKHTANWLLISLMMAVTGASAVMLILKSAATFWFQAVFQSSQALLG